MKKVKKGFTLIELLVVVLIIGILAAVALPQYQLAVRKTNVMKAVALAKPFLAAQERVKMATGKYTPFIYDLDVNCPWNLVKDDGKVSFCEAPGSPNIRPVFTFASDYLQYGCKVEKVGFNWIYGSKEVQLFLYDNISRKLCNNLNGEIRTIYGEERCFVTF